MDRRWLLRFARLELRERILGRAGVQREGVERVQTANTNCSTIRKATALLETRWRRASSCQARVAAPYAGRLVFCIS